jgi:hypothetical protein
MGLPVQIFYAERRISPRAPGPVIGDYRQRAKRIGVAGGVFVKGAMAECPLLGLSGRGR